MASVELAGVTVHKDGIEVVRAIDLFVDDGSVLAVLGATGSGKTTLLRAIAGLDPLSAGQIRFDGSLMNDVPTAQRDVAFAFQRPALLPHRTARRNIAMPLELRGDPIDQIRDRVGAEARAMHIESLLHRRPDQLSLGEAHAVQMARALVKQPRVLLLDEPFASIDPEWRSVLRRELMIIQRGFDVTTVVALNEPSDALAIADRVAIIEDGALVQIGSADDVYNRPRTVAAAHLIGPADALTVRIETDTDGAWITAPGMRIRAWQPELRAHDGRAFWMVVRPTWWELDPNGTVAATVESSVILFDDATIRCQIGSSTVSVATTRSIGGSMTAGDPIRLRLARYRLIDPTNGIALDLS